MASSHLLLLRHHRRHLSSTHLLFLTRALSSLSSSPIRTISDHTPPQPKPSDLSARLSFVFEHIDKIEKERAEKDEALQRIKAWRESKKYREFSGNGGDPVEKGGELGSGFGGQDQNLKNFDGSVKIFDGDVRNFDGLEGEMGGVERKGESGLGLMKKEVELAHPWPEWVGFMERLVHQNYFDLRRKDEDVMIEGLGGGGREFDMSEIVEEGLDFTRDFRTVQTAVLNFGKDRFDILRSLSRQDIQVLVGYGCPNADRRVIFSAKLLRKLVHLDEGDVCSSCSLRSSCEKAYLLTNKEDEARTIDVVRVLMTYGFDPINGSVTNKSLMKQKLVKAVIRKLLYEITKLSSVPIDPNLPPPVIVKRPPKVKQPPPPPKKRVGRDDIEMKKGDWLCTKCNFMNFAKNLICLQCDAKRPKRQLLPGEWECPKCNFLNYRRNMSCFHCEHKRPPDEYTYNETQPRQQSPNMRPGPGSFTRRPDVSDAWNFDFDDDESDGADVAAFEHADSHGHIPGNHAEAQNARGLEEDLYPTSRMPPGQSRDKGFSSNGQRNHGTGFDDFDDEDDDDIDSYEIDNHNRNERKDSSSIRFSDVERDSDSDGEKDVPRTHGARPSRRGVPSRSGNDLGNDSDDDLLVQPHSKSSRFTDSWQRDGGSRRPSIGVSSDDDLGNGDNGIFKGEHGGKRSNGRGFESDSRRGSRANNGSESDDDIGDGFSKGGRSNRSRGPGERSFGRGRDARGGPRLSESNDFDMSSSCGNRRGRRGFDDQDDNFGTSSSRGNRRGGRGFDDRDDDFDASSSRGSGSGGRGFDDRDDINSGRSGRRTDRSKRQSRGSHGNGRGSMGDANGARQMRSGRGRDAQNFGGFHGDRRESMRDEYGGQRKGLSSQDKRSFGGQRKGLSSQDKRSFGGPGRQGSRNERRGMDHDWSD
ncbi:Zinc finger protein VAR3, chloroplastic-like protein [Drosera capensis]